MRGRRSSDPRTPSRALYGRASDKGRLISELTLDERYSLTRRIMSLLEGWNLGASDILVLLQLPASIKARNLSRYRDAECFPDDPQVNRRLSYLDCTFAWDLTGSKAEYGKG